MLIMNSSDNSGLTVTNTSGWSKICRMHLYAGRPEKRDRLSTAAYVGTYVLPLPHLHPLPDSEWIHLTTVHNTIDACSHCELHQKGMHSNEKG